MLPDSARERPMSGSVVRVGPGKRDKDGSRKTPKVGFRVVSCAFIAQSFAQKGRLFTEGSLCKAQRI